MPLLSIDGLRITAGGAPLLDGVSLSLERGEVLGLIGESGAGKSTLGLAAAGFIRPGCRAESGRVVFEGTDLLGLAPVALRRLRGARIAYVAQSPAASFNPARRLGPQVAETLILHGTSAAEARRRVTALFAELDLPEPTQFGRRYPHQVSGGQLQRAMIAMAIACDPALVILDEPTTALDVTTQIEVLATIDATLRRHGAAALYISHDIAVVAQLATRILVLRHGRAIEAGSADALLRAPAADYTRQLIALRAPASTPGRAASGPPVLSLAGLRAGYRGHPDVLHDVSLDLAPGRTLAIVGESGSGKSSLARVICGLLPPHTGALHFAGAPLARHWRARSRDALRRIQLVYQSADTALNPRHSVARLLGRVVSFHFGGTRHSVAVRVSELLGLVGLPPDVARRRMGELSGGQKQRVGIARALAAQPDVIICDEITSALDPLVVDGILDLLRRLQQSTGLSYLFITHDIGVVRRIADEVAVMRDGQAVAQGPLDTVFTPPLHPATAQLLACVPEMRTGWLADLLAGRNALLAPAAGGPTSARLRRYEPTPF